MAQRSGSFDVIRVCACLAVVLLHLAATTVMQPEQLGTISWHMANFIDSAMRWAVPVFVMLSGALLLDGKKQTSPREFWTRRMNRLLPALLFWSVVYLAWRAFFWHQPLTLNTIALDLIAGRPYIHLYFLFLIAGLYLVTPFLATAASSLDSKQLGQAIVVMAALALGANMVDFLATSAFTLFVPYIAYYFAGLYCVRVLANRPAPYGMVLVGAILVTTLFTALSVSVNGLESRWSFYFYEDLSPTIMVMAVTVFMVLLQASLSPTVQSIAQRLAPWTLGVYVAHPIVVELLRNLYHTTMPAMFRPLYYIPITFVATIVIAFTAVALMQRIPILRRVV
ncbi:MAG: acyltransferase family protein [Nitrospirota bacterium]|nr:acyltransferase family protein [Nitrospirota bacterium]